jgi:hypothetical protein
LSTTTSYWLFSKAQPTMSIGADPLAAEKVIEYIESRVDEGLGNSGKNLEIAFYIEYADGVLDRIRKAPPSIFVHLYIERIDKISVLRKRLQNAIDRFPNRHRVVNPNADM